MDYGFQHQEATGEGARRIAREQIERAIAELSVEDDAVAARVHSVRKRVKKLRGLLRLIQGSLGPEVFARENAELRETGKRLVVARRSEAVLGAFDSLLARHPNELEKDAADRLRAKLVAARDGAVGALESESQSDDARTTLEAMLARSADWSLDRHGWSAVSKGFVRTYARGRSLLATARAKPTTENLHEWRKFAKYHFYHVRLLRRVWAAPMKTLAISVEELTELLGAEHDLDDLRLFLLEQAPSTDLMGPLESLLGLVEKRRGELRCAAMSLGARVFAERPRAISRRLRAYFRAWQREEATAGIDDAPADS